jgi:hypothetical protein
MEVMKNRRDSMFDRPPRRPNNTAAGCEMKTWLIARVVLALLFPILGLAQGSETEGSLFTYGATVDFNSQYLSRGLVCSNGTVIQPSSWVSASNFTFLIWSDRAKHKEEQAADFDEVDFALTYEHSLIALDANVTLTHYIFPHQEGAAPTTEMAITLSRVIGPLHVTSQHVFDCEAFPGAYYGTIGAGVEKVIVPRVTLSAATNLGWGSSAYNSAYADVHKTALIVGTLETSLLCNVGKHFYLKPHAEMDRILDVALRKTMERSPMNYGLTAGFEF